MNDSSLCLTRIRDEKFAQILAESDGGLSLTQAWCLSDPSEATPGVTPGRRVSASKAFKRVADKVAWFETASGHYSAHREAHSRTTIELDGRNHGKFA